MATGLMLKKLVLKNLLSFGPEGVELELGPLNVLIGPNASGKSNLIDAIRLLPACIVDVAEPIVSTGGLDSWIHKGSRSSYSFQLSSLLQARNTGPDEYDPFSDAPLRHALRIGRSYTNRPGVLDELVYSNVGTTDATKVFDRAEAEDPESKSGKTAIEKRKRDLPDSESILKYAAGSGVSALNELSDAYRDIVIYSDWNTSRRSAIRQPQPADADGSRLSTEGTNLPLVLSLLDNRPMISRQIVDELRRLHPRARAIKTPVIFGQVGGFIEEEGLSENVPFTRLSDGTLRWLCLLTVLLHPDPPSLICLEEPEVGLHPDMIRRLAQLLVEASARTQLIVTTHSDLLVSALSDHPESIIVCEHNGGSTRFFKVEAEYLSKYIQDYALGDAWLKGELGGTRY